MSKVWLTLRNLPTKHSGEPSFPNGYDAIRAFSLLRLIQDKRTSDEKRTEYRSEDLKLTNLVLEVLNLYRHFKPIESKPTNIVMSQKKAIAEDVIYISGKYVFVRKDFAEILKQFNLGKTKLFNVGCPLGKNGNVIYDREFYLLNVTEWRNFLVPEKSERVTPLGIYKEDFERHDLGCGDFVKSKVVLSKESLNSDVDVWHDPMLDDSIFFSDRLKVALDEKGLLIQTKHKKCLVAALERDN